MLAVALRSLAGQLFRNFEAIVINDAGEDVSPLIRDFAASFPVICITHESRRGVAAARNTGLNAARGKYVAYLDDDDHYLPWHLAALRKLLGKSGRKIAYTDARQDIQVFSDGKYRTVRSSVPYSHDFSRARLYGGELAPVLCVMHERACLNRSGMFAEYLPAHEDWDLWQRMGRHFDFLHIPRVTCVFTSRLDASSLSAGCRDDMRRTWYFVRAQGLLAENVPSVSELERAALQCVRLGPDNPDPCDVSVVLPVAGADPSRSFRSLAALCATIPSTLDVQLVLVGSGLDAEALTPVQRGLADVLPRPPLALCHAGEIGRIFAANAGAAAAAGEWLVFLEEDVQPRERWLEAMLEAMEKRPNAGALGGVLETAGTTLAGGVPDARGEPIFARELACPAATFSPVPLLSGLCLMTRRQTFFDLGGFDPFFAPAHYADADFCLRLTQRGMACGIAPAARLFWNRSALPLRQSAAGALSARAFSDRWAKDAKRSLDPDISGGEWSLRTLLWPSDGAMPPENAEVSIPRRYLDVNAP
jgi:GT2 family glycosyltransferase